MIKFLDRPILSLLTSHWLSLFGSGLVTTAAISWLLVLPLQMRGHVENPYLGIILFVALPILFVLGLLLIPIGVLLARRQVKRGVATVQDRPAVIRRFATFLAVTTVANVIIASQLTYRAVEHMETAQFCGQTCHVMAPEMAAYQNSPHSRVACVDCHVAPGAGGWFASKAAGVRQLAGVTFNNFQRPIASAIESGRLVPASETCENCHWPQGSGSVKFRVIPNYADDEANTATQTVLMLMVGGAKGAGGIHGAHFGPGVSIRYAALDPKRQTIPWVEYTNQETNNRRTYVASDVKADQLASAPRFQMQCVDCHNRPTHTFELPERAVNRALAAGDLAPGLPFLKKKSVELLRAEYPSAGEAAKRIPEALSNFYQAKYPLVAGAQRDAVAQAGKQLAAIYQRNVFPDLKVTWGTYVSNLGHTDSPGCFRCHDDAHVAADKATIKQDCAGCHELLAVEESTPEILKTLGLAGKIAQLPKR
ncbi:MAG: NapC/NirT family cytochrome c [Acidobacteria bacterium]|nr:NapC/NirT family cytochrome c [Acidobacteriota bacterium]